MKERVIIANKFIKSISDHGRRFFFNPKDDSVSYFKLRKNRIFFVDKYSKKEIYLHYRYWSNGFTEGGTLKYLVECLKDFIQGKASLPLDHLGPWPDHICGGDLWGYGDAMKLVREECSILITEAAESR